MKKYCRDALHNNTKGAFIKFDRVRGGREPTAQGYELFEWNLLGYEIYGSFMLGV